MDPGRLRERHRRATAWYAAEGETESALHHAVAAGDVDAAGALLWATAPRWASDGHVATLRRWLARFSDREIATTPTLGLAAALGHLAMGEGDLADRRTTVLSTRTELAGGLELLHAALGRDGVRAMVRSADRARCFGAEDTVGRAVSCLVAGVGRHLSGERRAARAQLEAGVRHGALTAPGVQALCLAQLVLLDADEEDWDGALLHVARARSHVQRGALADYPTMALVRATSAMVLARTGSVERATGDARRATRLMERVHDFAPWYDVEVRVVLARVALRLSDVARARTLLAEASRLVRHLPDAGVLTRVDRRGARASRCVRSGRARAADAGRGAGAAVPAHPPLPAPDRPANPCLPEHGQDPGARDLPQARRLQPLRSGPSRGGAGPARPRPSGMTSRSTPGGSYDHSSSSVGAVSASEAPIEERGGGWVGFAGVMVGIVGVLNVIYGIAAISNSNFYANGVHFVFGSLKTYGWLLLIVGVVQGLAAFGIFARMGWARWVGILTAGANMIIQLLLLPATPFLSLAIVAVDVLIIYGLVAYARRSALERRNRDAGRPSRQARPGPRSGIRAVTVVPAPTRERTSSSPPATATRSWMFTRPAPASVRSTSKPAPSSWIVNDSRRSSPTTRMVARVAPSACLATFCRASRQQK